MARGRRDGGESLWGEERAPARPRADQAEEGVSAKSQHVLDLQRQAGNAAVAGAVQRSLWGDDSWLRGQGGAGGPDTSKMPGGPAEGHTFDGKGGTFEKGGAGTDWKDGGLEQDAGHTFDGKGGTFEKGGSGGVDWKDGGLEQETGFDAGGVDQEGGFEDGSGKGVTFGEDGAGLGEDTTSKDTVEIN